MWARSGMKRYLFLAALSLLVALGLFAALLFGGAAIASQVIV